MRRGTFDLAGCSRVLHHVHRPEMVVASLARAIRFGGHVLVIDQIAPADPLVAVEIDRFERARDPEHQRLLPDIDLRALLEANGLVVLRTKVTEEQRNLTWYLDLADCQGEARDQAEALAPSVADGNRRVVSRRQAAGCRIDSRRWAGILSFPAWPTSPSPWARTSSRARSSPSPPTTGSSSSRARSPTAPTGAGARFVDVQYFDPYVKRARIQHASADTLDFVPSWYSYRMEAIGTERAARISLSGPTTTGLLDDLDQTRSGRDQLPFVKEILHMISDRTTNWTVVPCPTAAVGAARPSRRLTRAGARPALARDRAHMQARRAGPGPRPGTSAPTLWRPPRTG